MPITAKNAIFVPNFDVFLADRLIMDYISTKQYAEKYGISERTARNYCIMGKIDGAILVGKTWSVPANATLPSRKKQKKVSPLLLVLRDEQERGAKGGIYHKVQIDLTYNSNHIEGSRLTHDQTRYIYETKTIDISNEAINVDDIIETANHFRCIDFIISEAYSRLTEPFIKHLHELLKLGTMDSRKAWFNVGEYKRFPNEVGGVETSLPQDVHSHIKALLDDYNRIKNPSIEDIIDFHHRFEIIHPFQDGNGRVGRLIMFKECLAHDIVPFIITDELKMYYYRGLREWQHIRGYLLDTCLTAQDQFKALLDYFHIKY